MIIIRNINELQRSYRSPSDIFLTHCPKPFAQRGPNCGYYALSYATYFYSQINQVMPFYPARKKDVSPPAPASLREWGKQANVSEVGYILDVEHFNSILKNTPYRPEIKSFQNSDELHAIIQAALTQNMPCIIPIDTNRGCIETRGDGVGAHYVTIVGTYNRNNTQYYAAATWSNFYEIAKSHLFTSNDSLYNFGYKTYYKNSNSGWDERAGSLVIRAHTCRNPGLEGLRHQAVIIKHDNNIDIKALPNSSYFEQVPVLPYEKKKKKHHFSFFSCFKKHSKSHASSVVQPHAAPANGRCIVNP